MAYQPKDGYVWNPLRSLPRNSACPCGSGKKFKKCHLNVISMTIPTKEEVERQAKVKAETEAAKPAHVEA